MLEIKNTEVHGLDRACIASGNPMTVGEINTTDRLKAAGENIYIRCGKLGSAPPGSGHDNFLKGIIVQFDVKYPQYWTPEAQRYHWLDIISSQSKMHRLLTMGQSENFKSMFSKYVDPRSIAIVQEYIDAYNTTDPCDGDMKYYNFMHALSNLPMGFEMWETLSTNYLQLKTIVKQRMHHKLREDWGAFTAWALELPMFRELTGI